MAAKLRFLALMALSLCFYEAHAEVEGSLRLRGGETPFEGRVEIYLGEKWSRVGDSEWDLDDATVACRQLGFEGASFAPGRSYFGPAEQDLPVNLDHVRCIGEEGSLLECAGNVFNLSRHGNSVQGRDAGVVCAVENSLRLVNGNETTPTEGRLEILLAGEWRGVCAGNWSIPAENVDVACRQMGFTMATVDDDIVVGLNSSFPLVSLETSCSGSEFTLQSCPDFTATSECDSGDTTTLHCIGSPCKPHRPRLEEATCSAVTVTWTEPADQGSAITGHTVRFRPIGGVWETVSLADVDNSTEEELNVTVVGLGPGLFYEVQVRAFNDIGNGSYSESLVASTTVAELVPPLEFVVERVDQDSATLSWTVRPSCGSAITSYELLFHQLGSTEETKFVEVIAETGTLIEGSLVTFDLHNLRPSSLYEARVRVTGRHGNKNITHLTSSFTNAIQFTTLEAAPSAPPQGVSAFLSHLRSSAQFQWHSVPTEQQNGIITGYNLTCCYFIGDRGFTLTNLVGAGTFQYELSHLEAGALYQCTVSAHTAAGQGPESSPIVFTTPTDLNARPYPPSNVGFEVAEQEDSDSQPPLIIAHWNVTRLTTCTSNFSCSEVLGYLATCRSESSTSELRKTIWQSEVQNLSVATAVIPAEPYVRYSCSVAALNSYGIGLPGSIVFVETPERAPMRAPMQPYASNVGSDTITLHWTYVEEPPRGRLVGFKIETYLPDSRHPERNGNFIYEELFELEDPSTSNGYAHDLTFLDPGTEYNVFIAAATNAGEGPQARVMVKTIRTAPSVTPTSFQSEIVSFQEPYIYSFSWQLPQSEPTNPRQTPMPTHAGFVLHCRPNSSSADTRDLMVSHVVFTSEVGVRYSTTVPMPGSCSSETSVLSCVVSAFNENGEGPVSESIVVFLPCSDGSEEMTFSNTFLTNPYYSLAFISALVILILAVVVVIIILCICNLCGPDVNRQGRNKHRKPFNTYNSVDTYDESYVSMAPSDSRIKSHWSSNRSSTSRRAPGIMVSEPPPVLMETFNPYDEIPGDPRQENVYDEIHPRTMRVISTITDENTDGSAGFTSASRAGVRSSARESVLEFCELQYHRAGEIQPARILENPPPGITVEAGHHPPLTATSSTATDYADIVVTGNSQTATPAQPKLGTVMVTVHTRTPDHLQRSIQHNPYYNILYVDIETQSVDLLTHDGKGSDVSSALDSELVPQLQANASTEGRGPCDATGNETRYFSDCTELDFPSSVMGGGNPSTE